MTKMLFMLTLLLLSAQSHAQFTGAVWSGTRVSAPSGGEYITLPGCSTQTEVLGVYGGIVGYAPINFPGDTVYTYTGEYPNGGLYSVFFCGVATLYVDNFVPADALYSNAFIDRDMDGVFEEQNVHGSVLMSANGGSRNIEFPYSSLTFFYTNVRTIFSKTPVTNSCPSSIEGFVVDGEYALWCD